MAEHLLLSFAAAHTHVSCPPPPPPPPGPQARWSQLIDWASGGWQSEYFTPVKVKPLPVLRAPLEAQRHSRASIQLCMPFFGLSGSRQRSMALGQSYCFRHLLLFHQILLHLAGLCVRPSGGCGIYSWHRLSGDIHSIGVRLHWSCLAHDLHQSLERTTLVIGDADLVRRALMHAAVKSSTNLHPQSVPGSQGMLSDGISQPIGTSSS